LTGHNTDYAAIRELLRRHAIPADTTFALRGSGGMAKAVASARRDAGLGSGVVIARNETTGPALARACGLRWRRELGDERPRMLIQVTPLGMAGPDAHVLAFPEAAIDAAEIVFDVVALPHETPLVARARAAGKKTITGDEVIVLQAVDQFVLYTAITPSAEQIAAAAAFALG
ncbi:MAG: shikimate 5-dehydrogenase, partial [Myxococcota bacterium]|nr:shikimate 5-dehydrogenase [Myxococcota bacterium]